MINKKVPRHQADGKQLDYSQMSALVCVGEDMARQEFKAEADINNILKRYGVNGSALPIRPVVYQEVDYTIDLQQAMGAIETAQDMYRKLPPSLREKYPTWQSILNGIHNGSLKIDLSNQVDPSAAERLAQLELERRAQDVQDEAALAAIESRRPKKKSSKEDIE